MKHYTILELNNDECPMIGTIQNVIQDKNGLSLFKDDLLNALSEHFDIIEEGITIPDIYSDMLNLSGHEDITVLIDGNEFEIRILETWFY